MARSEASLFICDNCGNQSVNTGMGHANPPSNWGLVSFDITRPLPNVAASEEERNKYDFDMHLCNVCLSVINEALANRKTEIYGD